MLANLQSLFKTKTALTGVLSIASAAGLLTCGLATPGEAAQLAALGFSAIFGRNALLKLMTATTGALPTAPPAPPTS